MKIYIKNEVDGNFTLRTRKAHVSGSGILFLIGAILFALCAVNARAGKTEDVATVNTLLKTADEALNNGDPKSALEGYLKALTIIKSLGAAEEYEANCYLNIGGALQQLGRYDEAIRHYYQALEICGKLKGGEKIQAVCCLNLGKSLELVGLSEDAVKREEQALAILSNIKGSEFYQAYCHMNLGSALTSLGKKEEAIQNEGKALAIFTAKKDLRSQANCHQIIGSALRSIGKYEEAIDRQQQALELFKAAHESGHDQAACHQAIGISLVDLGRYEQAIQHLQTAMTLLQSDPGTEEEQGETRMGIGIAFYYMRRYDEAIRQYEQVLAVFKQVSGESGNNDEKRCWGNIGDAHLAAGHLTDAIEAYNKSVSSWNNARGSALAYSRRHGQGDEAHAEEEFLNGLSRAEQLRTTVLASEHRAEIFIKPYQVFPDFVAFLCVWTAWQPRFNMPIRERPRASRCPTRKGVAEFIPPGYQIADEDKALSRRISKLASLREAAFEGENRKKLSAEIESLQQQRDSIEVKIKQTALGAYVAPTFRKPMEMAKELKPDQAVLQYSIGEKEGWLLIMTQGVITAHKLSADVPALPELLARQEATLDRLTDAWKTRPGKIGIDGLVLLARARAEDLSRPEKDRRNLIATQQEQAILQRLGAAALPEPALAELRTKGIHQLIIVPDGSLHYIPFAMLRLKNAKDAGSHYLAEEFSSSYISAMTTLDTIRKQTEARKAKRAMQRRPLLAFANPSYGDENKPTLPASMAAGDDMVTRLRSFRSDTYQKAGLHLTSLPETEREAMRAASLFAPPKTYNEFTATDPDGEAVVFAARGASEYEVKRLLGGDGVPKARRQWQYVLFSTHGLADTHNGMLSCLALATPAAKSEEDGYLQAQEIMNLSLDADVVMLSACQTGLGRLSGGEGFVGLSTAFFYAGTQSVCVSLWQVPSGPTTQLVPEFFSRLKAGEMDRAEALRRAQLQVMRQGRGSDGKPADYSTPFCWAAFVLMGDYR